MLRALGITDTDILDITNTNDAASDEESPDETDYSHILALRPTLSTMTACGNLGGRVNVNKVITHGRVIPYWCLRDGVLRIEGYSADDTTKWVHTGISRKYLIRKNPGKGPFKNAATFYLRLYDSEMDEFKEPSVKVFYNGGFQITGVRTPAQMRYAVTMVTDAVASVAGGFIEEGAPFPERAFQEVCMMNADVCTGYTLSRSEIQSILTTESKLRSTFESTAYQGVNIKFFWNMGRYERGEPQIGLCPCDVQCVSSGKKSSIKKTAKHIKTNCTKVTIAPFQTGKIIITGAKNEQQVKDASEWILRFIVDNADRVIGKPVTSIDRKRGPDPMRKSYPFLTSVPADSLVCAPDP